MAFLPWCASDSSLAQGPFFLSVETAPDFHPEDYPPPLKVQVVHIHGSKATASPQDAFVQCRRIHPFLQADEALVQQIARSALSAGSCVKFSSTQPSSCQQHTHTGKSTYSASQATVKSFSNRCVNQVELRKVSQRNLAVIIRKEALKISGVVD